MKHTEEFRVGGEDILVAFKKLIAAGNIRRVIFSNKEGKSTLEIPMILLVIIAIIFPALIFIGIIIALLFHFTLSIVREEKESSGEPSGPTV